MVSEFFGWKVPVLYYVVCHHIGENEDLITGENPVLPVPCFLTTQVTDMKASAETYDGSIPKKV